MQTAGTLVCPNCELMIPLEDVNVSTDIALCRRCGRNHSYALLLSRGGLPVVSVLDPPRGERFCRRWLNRLETPISLRPQQLCLAEDDIPQNQ